MFCHYYTSNFFQFKKFGVEIMKHYPVKNVLREMVQYGVMEIVYGATISVWNQEDQVINYKKTFTNIHFDGYPTCHSVYTALKMQMYFANNSPFNLFF